MAPRTTVVLRLLAVACIVAALLAPTSAPAAASSQSAGFSPAHERAYVEHINAARAANGLGPVSMDPSMRKAARNWTSWMVDNDTLAHADDIVTGAPSDWLKVGENVGRGSSLNSIWEAFLASPGHAANVLDPEYTLVGIGVIWSDEGRMYTTHRFASVSSAAPAPQPEPEPEPTSTPRPTPQPTPQPTPVPLSTPTPQPAPEQLPLADTALVSADPARVAATMTLLLDIP